jgi:S-adenosylmethionine/arginine decarboxylase-like enzyme
MSAQESDDWLNELVELIDMEKLYGPFSTFCTDPGNEGVTGLVGLTTSHASLHAWHECDQPFMKLDIYSCRAFSVETVFAHLQRFAPVKCEYVVLDRNGTIRVAERGVKYFTPPSLRERIRDIAKRFLPF